MTGTALAALVSCGVFTFSTSGWSQVTGVNGGVVVGGQATIANTAPGHVTVTQSSQRGVIDWRSFSIAAGERVDFLQPGTSAVTLNRVVGPDPSVIAGRLTATGQLILVNGAGVVFANGAQINAAGLVASTSSIADPQRFMRDGTVSFDRPSADPNASVVNAGTITVSDGGLVGLVGNTASNSGVINARLGRVTIAGAETFTVDLAGDGLINFQVGNPVSRQPLDAQGNKRPLASNIGTINADGGAVTLTARAARGVVDNVVNAGGVINARAVREEGGAVVFGADEGGTLNVTGTVDVSGTGPGQRGGRVVATAAGGRVNVASTARLDASGDSGGGAINIGGSLRGQGPVASARDTRIATGAQIKADATRHGDGGRVIVWADNATVFGGSVSARGGSQGGNGGFAEVSGKAHLDYRGTADLRAPLGAAGTLLLDPTTLTIQAANPDINGNSTVGDDLGSGTIGAGDFPGADSIITAGAVATQLELGNVTLSATKTITVASDAEITWSKASSLSLSAGEAIVIAGKITAKSAGTGVRLALTAGDTGIDIRSTAVLNLGAGDLNASALGVAPAVGGPIDNDGAISAAAVSLSAGTTVLGSGAISASGAVSLSGAKGGVNYGGAVAGASLTVAASGGGVTLNNSANKFSTFSTSGTIGGSVIVAHDGALTINQTDAGSNAVAFAVSNGGITLAGALTAKGSQTSTGGATLAGSGAVAIEAPIQASGANVVISGNKVTQSDKGTITANELAVTASDGSIDLTQATSALTIVAAQASKGDVGLKNTGALIIATTGGISGIVASGNVQLSAGGTVSQDSAGGISAAGLAVTTSAGNIDLATASNSLATVAASSSGTITLKATTGFAVGSVGPVGKLNTLVGVAAVGATSLEAQGVLAVNAAIMASSANVTLLATSVSQKAAGVITAKGLSVTASTGGIDLTQATNVLGTLAASAKADIGVHESDGFIIGGVGSLSGITTPGNVQLKAGGTITQTKGVSAAGLGITTTSGDVNLTGVDNNALGTFAAASTGFVGLLEADGFTVGSVGSIGALATLAGVSATGQASFKAGGSISQTPTGIIAAAGLAAVVATGDIGFDGASNATTVVAFKAAGIVAYTSSTGITVSQVSAVGDLPSVSGITAPATTGLRVTGATAAISQTKAITTGTLDIATDAAGSGTVTLTHTDNRFDTLRSSGGLGSGAVQITDDAGGLTVEAITGKGAIAVTTEGGALIVSGAVNTSGGNQNISLTALDGAVTVNATLNAGSGTVALRSGGSADITAASAAITAGLLTVQTGSNGGVTLGSGASHNIASIATGGTGIGSGGLTFTQTRALGLSVGPITSRGAVSITENGGKLSVGGAINTSATDAKITLAGSGGIALGADVHADNGTVTLVVGTTGTISQTGGTLTAGALIVDTSANPDVGDVSITASSGANELEVVAGSRVAGNLTLNVGSRTVEFLSDSNGNDTTDVGGALSTSGSIQGSDNLRLAGGIAASPNVIVASGAGPDFVLTPLTLNGTGPSVTIVLTSAKFVPAESRVGKPAITLTSANNVDGPVTIRTRDPLLQVGNKVDYNLVQSTASPAGDLNFNGKTITIEAGQTLGNVTLNNAGNTGDATFVLVNTGATTLRTSGNLAVSGTAASLITTSAALSIPAPLTVTGPAFLSVTDNVVQAASAPITASKLTIVSQAGEVLLDGAANNVNTLSATAAAAGKRVRFRDADGFSVAGIATDLATGVVSLHSESGDGTTSGAITQTGAITAGHLRVLAPQSGGAVTLNNFSNEVGTLAGVAFGDFSYFNVFNSTNLTVGTVLGTSGVLSTGGFVELVNGGSLIVSGSISAGTDVRLSAGLDVAVNGNVTAGTTGMVELFASLGSVTQTGTVTAGSLRVEAETGIALAQNNNIAGNGIVALHTISGDITFANTNGFVIGTLTGSAPFAPPTTSGITTGPGGTATLTAGGNVTQQSGATVTAGTLSVARIASTNPVVTLANTGNSVTFLGGVSLSDGSLTLATSGGLTVSGNVAAGGGISLTADTAGGAGGITINAGLNATSAGAVVLDAAGSITQPFATSITAASVTAKSATGSVALGSSANAFGAISGSSVLSFTATSSRALTVAAGGVTASSGSVTLVATTSADADIVVGGTVAAGAGSVLLAAVRDITVNSSVSSAVNVTLSASTGDIQLGGIVSAAGSLTSVAGGDIQVNASVAAASGNVTLNATGGIQIGSSVSAGNVVSLNAATGNIAEIPGGGVSAVGLDVAATAGSVDLSNAASNKVSIIAGSAGGSFSYADSQSSGVTVGVISSAGVTSANGAVTITASAGTLAVSRAVQGKGDVSLTAASDVTVSAAVTSASGAVILQAGAGALSVTADIQASSGVSLTSNLDLIIGGLVTATAGDITATSKAGALTSSKAIAAPAGSVVLQAAGNVAFSAGVTGKAAGGRVTLASATGSVIELLGGSVTAGQLVATAAGNVDLALINAAGDQGFAASAGGFVTFISDRLIALDQVGGVSGVGAGGAVVLANLTGNITQTASGIITAGGGLLLQSLAGTITLDQANAIAGNIAVVGTVQGDITIRNTGSINVGPVGPVVTATRTIAAFGGIDGTGRTVSLISDGGTITQGAAVDDRIIAAELRLRTGNRDATLANAGNQFDAIGNTDLGSGRLTVFDSAGGLTVSSPLVANGGVILTTQGAFSLPGSISVAGGDISLTSLTAGIALGSTLAAPTGEVRLDARGGAVTQSGGTITAQSLQVHALGSVDLTQAGNDVISISGSSDTGAFAWRDATAVSITGLTTANNNITIVAGAGGLSGGIAILAPIAAGTGTVRLQSGGPGDIIQAAGASITAATLMAVALDGSVNFGGTTNAIGNIAGAALGSTFTLVSTGSITVTTVAGDALTVGAAGVVANNGDVALISGGTITLLGVVNAVNGAAVPGTAAGSVTLVASGGAIVQGGASTVVGNSLLAIAGGGVDLASAGNDVVLLAGAAGGAFRYRDASALVVGTVGGTGGITTQNFDIGIHAGGSLTLSQPIDARGAAGGVTAVVRLQATNGNLIQDVPGTVTGATLLANTVGTGDVVLTSPGNAVQSSAVVGSPGFVAGTAAGNFRFVNANSLTVSDVAVAGDPGLGIAGAVGVTAGTGRLVDLGVAAGNLSIEGPISATAGMIVYRRVAGAPPGMITVGGAGGGTGTGGAYLLVVDLTGSPSEALTGLTESGAGSTGAPRGLFVQPTPPTTASPAGLGGPNSGGTAIVGALQGIDTTVYLVGGAASSITSSAPGQFGVLGVYAPEGAQVNLQSIVRAIPNTTARPIGPFGPGDPPPVSGPPEVVARDYVRKSGLPSLSQRFNSCVIAGPSCTTIFTQVANPPAAADDAVIGIASSSLDDSSIILVNQGNEEFIEDEEERRRRAGGQR